nr:MAG TPA: hypothetical protein [Caudoviricetes sp.]
MANVIFKQGLQDSLDLLSTQKKAIEGAFYLTSDSHRLYIGLQDKTVAPVNEGVTTVPGVGSLPAANTLSKLHAGEFYYATAENILCVFNGKEWIQINANTDTKIDGFEIEVTVADNKASVKSSAVEAGSGTKFSDTFSVEGKGGIKVSATGKDLVLTGDTYTLERKVSDDQGKQIVSVGLKSVNGQASTQLDFQAGENITFDTTGEKTVIKAKNATVNNVKAGFGTSEQDTAEKKNGFYVTVQDSEGNGGTSALDPKVKVGTAEGFYEVTRFEDGIVSLPVYSKREIDNKFLGLDAMTYKGTLGTGGSNATLNTAQLENGDTFLVVGDDGFTVTVNSETYSAAKGDMIICRGTETPATGKIDPTTLVLDIVHSGDDAKIDTTYKLVPTANGISLVANGGSAVGGITISSDEYLEIADNKNTTNGTNTVTIKHKKITQGTSEINTSAGEAIVQSPNSTLVVPVVEKVVRDPAGHVTAVKFRNYNLKDTNGHLETDAKYEISQVAADLQKPNKTGALIASSVSMKTSAGDDAGTAKGAFSLESETMKVTAKQGVVTVDLEWGSF